MCGRSRPPAWLITGFIVLVFGGLWFAFPLARRHR